MSDYKWIFWYDWVIVSFFIFLIILPIAKFYVSKSQNPIVKKYFFHGLILKIIGSIGFALYHQFVYKGGDTYVYFDTGVQVGKYFNTDFNRFFRLTFLPVIENLDLIFSDNWLDPNIMLSEANMFQVRLVSIFQFFSFKSYLPICIFFSTFSYLLIFQCVRTFIRLFPDHVTEITISFLYIPTVLFWGSGLGKDSVCLGSICALTTCAYYLIIFKERRLRNLIGLIISVSILFIVKPYIPLSYLPPLLIAIIFQNIKNIKNKATKVFMLPFSMLILFVFLYLLNDLITNNFNVFALDNLANKIAYSNKTMQVNAGSAFDLGIRPEDIHDFSDMAPYFPKGIVATIFRPWFWEVNNSSMFLAGIESFWILIFFIYVLIKKKFAFIKNIFNNPILLSLTIFCLIFAGLVGLSTSNFGTLVRYKLPCIPFLIMILLISNNTVNSKLD